MRRHYSNPPIPSEIDKTDKRFDLHPDSRGQSLIDFECCIDKFFTDDVDIRDKLRRDWGDVLRNIPVAYNTTSYRKKKIDEFWRGNSHLIKHVNTHMNSTYYVPYALFNFTKNNCGFSYMEVGSKTAGVWDFYKTSNRYQLPFDEQFDWLQEIGKACPMFGKYDDWVIRGWHYPYYDHYDEGKQIKLHERAEANVIITKDSIVHYTEKTSKYYVNTKEAKGEE